ncbi:MAG TPA: MBL fold metallo-hydrolase [Candidatus Baltobacteraceae bacterium]|jgi:L-ascorbate metabolism protein UlaG (beta-lactamase superfamily)|nr:MBL fold metallo-hydrolase [Candidatus Baltobacteraceae bacterium]
MPPEHHIGTKFRNLEGAFKPSFGGLLRWIFRRRPKPWLAPAANNSHPPPPASVAPGDLAVTFIGHSSFLLQFSGSAVLMDPIFSERASPVSWAGPKRVRPPGLNFEQLPRIDLVLLSHDHYDHMDIHALRRLREAFHPLFVSGLNNGAILRSLKIDAPVELDWWQSHRVNDNTTVTMTPAQHFSGRRPWGRNGTLWGGFVLETEGWRVYFAGDSGYAGLFRDIGRRFPGLDLAFIPIGAYMPRWFMSPVHMDPAEAVQAHLDVGARQSIAMHFGTFQLTDEPIDEPVQWLERARAEKGLAPEQFCALEPGQTLLCRKPAPRH